jgi:hypothetical protein
MSSEPHDVIVEGRAGGVVAEDVVQNLTVVRIGAALEEETCQLS